MGQEIAVMLFQREKLTLAQASRLAGDGQIVIIISRVLQLVNEI